MGTRRLIRTYWAQTTACLLNSVTFDNMDLLHPSSLHPASASLVVTGDDTCEQHAHKPAAPSDGGDIGGDGRSVGLTSVLLLLVWPHFFTSSSLNFLIY